MAWEDLDVPDAVIVTPCGYDLDGAVAQAGPIVERYPEVPVIAIDSASYVVRAGPRLVDGVEALARALHPACFADGPSDHAVLTCRAPAAPGPPPRAGRPG
ncbi:hypothetical protein [Actinomycetospora termitidis]|uniref:Fe/B12 periplasmic-binding domain-containing protein n=1 Tax=Actinomycetospora termitidis TaxID=3053470 RepID=A0ABT7M417_9PSEU|nr:hypothetical protein [Actinomycetospora sp. Odt1-22]MDL5154964.1 hypothetical protein [Actinomycetospora sp. Odt1-22]